MFELFALQKLVLADPTYDRDELVCGPFLEVIYRESTENRDPEIGYLGFAREIWASLSLSILMDVQINHNGVVHMRPTDQDEYSSCDKESDFSLSELFFREFWLFTFLFIVSLL